MPTVPPWPPGLQTDSPVPPLLVSQHLGARSPQDARGPSWEFLVTPWRRMAVGFLLEGDIAYRTYPTPLAGTVRKRPLSSFGWPHLGHPKGPRITTTFLTPAPSPAGAAWNPWEWEGLTDLQHRTSGSSSLLRPVVCEWALPTLHPKAEVKIGTLPRIPEPLCSLIMMSRGCGQ